MAKKKSIVDRISDRVTEIVDTASAAATDVLKPDPEAVAATPTNRSGDSAGGGAGCQAHD